MSYEQTKAIAIAHRNPEQISNARSVQDRVNRAKAQKDAFMAHRDGVKVAKLIETGRFFK
jgi:hypothetical protein